MTIRLDPSDLPQTRSDLGLVLGTSANNVVQLDGSAKLPAVDGSALTNLPASGAYTKVSSGTITNSNLVVNNISKPIRIVFANTAGGTTGIGSVLFLRTSTDNGSSFESGSNTYSWSRNIMNLYIEVVIVFYYNFLE